MTSTPKTIIRISAFATGHCVGMHNDTFPEFGKFVVKEITDQSVLNFGEDLGLKIRLKLGPMLDQIHRAGGRRIGGTVQTIAQRKEDHWLRKNHRVLTCVEGRSGTFPSSDVHEPEDDAISATRLHGVLLPDYYPALGPRQAPNRWVGVSQEATT